jgi:hypothetical protein
MNTSITSKQNRSSNSGFSSGTSIYLDSSSQLDSTENYIGTDISLEKYFKIESLNERYYFDSENIDSFLLENPKLIPFLLRAFDHLSNLLPNSIFILEVGCDYELDEWKTLFINIINNLQDSSFDQKLQSFVVDWLFYEDVEIRKIVTVKEIF